MEGTFKASRLAVQKLVYRVPFPRYHGHTALCDELQFLAREYADIAQLYR